MSELSSFELGWLVGILEGEGCFQLNTQWKTPYVVVGMSDEDTVNRVAGLFERVTKGPCNVHQYAPSGKMVQYRFVAKVGGPNARIVMQLVVKYMSHRRRQKIWQCLNGFLPKRVKIDLVQLGLIKAVS